MQGHCQTIACASPTETRNVIADRSAARGVSRREARRHRPRGRREADQARLPRRRRGGRRRRRRRSATTRTAPPAPRSSPTARALWRDADIVFKVRAPDADEVAPLREGTVLVSFIWPAQNPELMQRSLARKATVLAMDSVPRISRAQKLDALSSMANIGGYRAVIEAAHAVRPLLHRARSRPPARCRRPRCSSSAPASRASRRSARRRASARSCAPTTRGPRSPTRSSRSAASSCRSTTWRKAPASAATPR